MAALGDGAPAMPRSTGRMLPPRTLSLPARAAARLARALDAPLPAVTLELRRAVEAAGWFSTWLPNSGVRTVVVATQHGTIARAALWAARQAGIATAYLPHATYWEHPLYEDLPAAAGLLMGEGEVARYRALGGDPDRLAAVGAPGLVAASVDTGATVHHDADTVVWALPAPTPDVTSRWARVMAAAAPSAVWVAPHPRTPRDVCRRLQRSGWRVLDGERTVDAAARRAAVIVQSGSGVGLEALLRGIPVVDLRDTEAPSRPYLEHDGVPWAANSDTLRRALAHAARCGVTEELAQWAHWWCDPVGDEAAARAAARLRSLPASYWHATLDGWAVVTERR